MVVTANKSINCCLLFDCIVCYGKLTCFEMFSCLCILKCWLQDFQDNWTPKHYSNELDQLFVCRGNI